MLGVSVYPDLSGMDEIEAYLRAASSHGFGRVFASLFSVPGGAQEILSLFSRLIGAAHSLGMQVSLDVNGSCLRRLGAAPEDLSVFHEIGCDILRMDVPMGMKEMLSLIANPYGIKIEMNASLGEGGERLIADLLRNGADPSRLLLCHNFYPQRYTGMRWKKFQETNRRLRKTQVPIGAFITSQAEHTHGVWEARDGRCTVERHRDLPADLQCRELLATGCVDDVMIGNAFATETELRRLEEAAAPVRDRPDNPMHGILRQFGAPGDMQTDRSSVPKKLRICMEDATDLEREILFSFYPHMDVGDSSEWIWRSRMPRMVYADRDIPARSEPDEWFQRGDVLIVNDRYPHYAGEVQIALLPIRNDGTRNRVGRLDNLEMEMLDLIGERDVVVFLPQ